jgi:hypothetical protein
MPKEGKKALPKSSLFHIIACCYERRHMSKLQSNWLPNVGGEERNLADPEMKIKLGAFDSSVLIPVTLKSRDRHSEGTSQIFWRLAPK